MDRWRIASRLGGQVKADKKIEDLAKDKQTYRGSGGGAEGFVEDGQTKDPT